VCVFACVCGRPVVFNKSNSKFIISYNVCVSVCVCVCLSVCVADRPFIISL